MKCVVCLSKFLDLVICLSEVREAVTVYKGSSLCGEHLADVLGVKDE